MFCNVDRPRALLERLLDTEMQRRATMLYRNILRGLAGPASVVMMRSRQTGRPVFRIAGASLFRRVSGVPEARYLSIDVPIHKDRTSLMPLDHAEGSTRYVLTWMPSRIRLPRGATHLGHVHLDELREILVDAAKRDRKTLLHELTHFVDVARLGPKAWRAASRGYKSDVEDLSRYANDPIELNAYFQQIAAAEREDFDAALQGDDPTWDLWPWIDLDVKQSVREFTSRIDRNIWRHLTEKNRRRFRKRAAMFYDEVRQQARDAIAELAAQGDEDAQYMLSGSNQ